MAELVFDLNEQTGALKKRGIFDAPVTLRMFPAHQAGTTPES